MKSIIAALLILICITVSAQDLPFVDGKVVYEVDLPFPGMAKDQIYEKSMSFVDDVLAKHSFYLKSSNKDSGDIMTSGMTALTNKSKKGFMWDVGEASRLRFNYDIKVSDESSKVIIYNITVVKLDVNKELVKPFEEDIMEEKRVIQSAKDGSFKAKRVKRYDAIADNVNNTFYSMIGLYKRYVDK